MTNEEAAVYLRHYLELVNESKDNIDADYLSFLTGVHTLAIEALEKQIPKEPIDDSYPWATCPVCGGSVFMEHIKEHIQNKEKTYCEHCGQTLDWR